jgi:hypothetical protein
VKIQNITPSAYRILLNMINDDELYIIELENEISRKHNIILDSKLLCGELRRTISELRSSVECGDIYSVRLHKWIKELENEGTFARLWRHWKER